MAAAEEAAFEQLVGWAAGRLASLMGLDADEADSADDMARCVCVLATILNSIACYCTKLLLLQATMYYYATARATAGS